MRIANAGQSQPLLWKSGRCEKVSLVGFPLGIYDDVSYEEWGVVLDPSDVLVFHSDGLAESANAEGQLYGADRDRKSTRLNSSHSQISYAVFCLKKKKKSERSFMSSKVP